MVQLIQQCNGLIAASTGPLHLSAFLGKNTLGIYSSNNKDRPQAWGSVSINSLALSHKEHCQSPCNRIQQQCACVLGIKIKQVKNIIQCWEANIKITKDNKAQQLWISQYDLK